MFLLLTQYKQNQEMFKQTARLWSHVYAGAPVSSPEYTRKIDKLCAMGFEKVSMSQLLFLLYKTEQCLNSPPPTPFFFPECSNSGVVVKILGRGDGDRAAAQ